VELAGDVQLLERWLVHASYTGQRVALAPLPGSRDTTNALLEADDPAHMFSVRSYVNLPGNFELDGFFRAVGKLRASKLPGYEELDARIGWHANDRLELASSARPAAQPAQVRRARSRGKLARSCQGRGVAMIPPFTTEASRWRARGRRRGGVVTRAALARVQR
jgi:hypothetical protein